MTVADRILVMNCGPSVAEIENSRIYDEISEKDHAGPRAMNRRSMRVDIAGGAHRTARANEGMSAHG